MRQGTEIIPLHDKINFQINHDVEILKLDLNFLEAPKPSWDNYENVTQNSPECF